MRRSQLELFLKSINSGLKVTRHSNRGEHIYHGESDAVYFHNKFIGAIPPGNIYLHKSKLYRGKHQHRSLKGLLDVLAREGALLPHKRRSAYAQAH
jgi:hypothetical protein